MDGRALELSRTRRGWGTRGTWEGDTLESSGFHGRSWMDRDGHPHTERLRMTEQYRRPSVGALEIEVTFSDPAAYGKAPGR